MCGIIGYTGQQQAAPILMEGLSRLEYRGYDSAGIAVIGPNWDTSVHKASGKLIRLKKVLRKGMPAGITGIGHTRWATHGGPTDFNAHPHTGNQNSVTVVHNGVLVQDAREFLGATTHRNLAQYAEHSSEGPIGLQDHGNPVRFRNVWVRRL